MRVRLDLRHRPDRRVVLDERPSSDDDVVADDDRSRTHDWSPRITRAPTFVPAKTARLWNDRPVADLHRRQLLACRGRVRRERWLLPTTACSSTLTPSPSTVPG
jgi:hypothetical protein